MPRRLFFMVAIACSLLASTLDAHTIHVSLGGDDSHPGNEAQPVASLQRAVAMAETLQGQDVTIVVHEGVYHGPVRLLKPDDAQAPAITITAAVSAEGGFVEATLDGSYDITKAELIVDMPGVYAVTLPGYSAASTKPEMWEMDTRTRYTYAADLRGVMGRNATFFHDVSRERVVFHTSDGQPPEKHSIGLERSGARTATRLFIQRPNVTVRGLTLRNGVDIAVAADRVVIEDCRTFNSVRAIIISPGAKDVRITRHLAVDVATGVLSHGDGTVVEDSTFQRPLDAFAVQLYTQDQSGIQFYAPAEGGTARGNLVVGFHLGVFMKGVKGNFHILKNTIVGPGSDQIGSYGIFRVNNWRDGDVCQGNIAVAFHMPAPTHQVAGEGFIHENNCYWDGSDMPGLKTLLERYQELGTSKHDRIADPRLIDPAGGDFRLAHDSPMAAADGKATAGALAVAPAGVQVVPAPTQTPAVVTLKEDGQPVALVGQPMMRTNDHGLALAFTTNIPCSVNVLWGRDVSCNNRIAGPRHIERRYDSNVGNEFTVVDEPLVRTSHHATVIPDDNASAETPLFYRLELVNAAGVATLTPVAQVKLQGQPRTWHVAKDGDDDAGDGPLRTIQAAVDRALPGDRILIADGLYGEPIVIRHGGVAAAPLVIEAVNQHQAIIDTDQSPDIHTMMQIEDAKHLTLRGLEFRWFHAYAIYAYQTHNLDIQHCKFWNMHFTKGRRSGVGVFATRGSQLRIDHCLFFNMNAAFDILRTDGFVITHNTALRLTHRVALFHRSAPGLLRNNSFTFTGNYHYHISLSAQQMAQFDSDYNNLAQYVHISYAHKDDPTPAELAEMMDPSSEDPSIYPWGNKGIASVSTGGYQTVPFFSRWQKRFGKDQHSIFAHPRYVDPRNHDFRLQSDSPNINGGEGGQYIGAFGAAAP